MTIKIIKNLVPSSKHSIKAPYTMKAEYITFHNTANDATARKEISYMIGNDQEVSYHFAVDDKEVVQGVPLNRNAWHTGDSGKGTGNRKSIGVEVCDSKSGGAKYKKAEQLAIKFIAQLLHERKWGVDKVKTHKHWTEIGVKKGYSSYVKNCPHRVLDEGRWQTVLNAIQAELVKLTGTSTSTSNPSTKPSQPSTSKPQSSKPNYNTKSIVTFLASIKQPFSMAHRKKLASYYNVGSGKYSGSAVHNLQLLDLIQRDYKAIGKLRTSKPTAPSKPSKSIAQMAKEVAQGKHGNGHSNRRKSLGVSQDTYDKVRAEVNKGATTTKTSGKTVSQMANEIINGKGIPHGHAARQKHFGISKTEYEQVRKEVNRLMM